MDLDNNEETYNQLSIIKQENCIKFGEIIVSNDGKFIFVCNFCQEIFFKSILLTGHIIENHVTIKIESIKEAFLTNSSDLDIIENKVYVKKDITNFDSNNLNFTEQNNEDLSPNNSQNKNTSLSLKIDEYLQSNPSQLNLLKLNIKMELEENCEETELKKIKKKKIRLINGKANWQCQLCNVVLKCTSKYDHLKRHSGQTLKYKHCDDGPERPYECTQCDNKYKLVSHLKDHVKRAHLKLRNYKCNFCEKAFFSNDEAKRHEISWHSQPKPNICEICGLSFTTTQQFRNHKRKHAEPTFQCNKCEKKFHLKKSLKIHEICHNEYKPYQCKICLKRFPRHKSYTRHMVLHSGVKDYICKICGKAFGQASGIGCHMKSHGIKYNACNVIRKSKIVNDNELE